LYNDKADDQCYTLDHMALVVDFVRESLGLGKPTIHIWSTYTLRGFTQNV